VVRKQKGGVLWGVGGAWEGAACSVWSEVGLWGGLWVRWVRWGLWVA
jgi:hypothetical protein